MQQEKSKDLKKHVATVHCTNNLSLLQRKLVNVLLYNAYMELSIKEVHTIKISDLCKILGFNSHNYAALKDALMGLISTIIEWNLVDDNSKSEDWGATAALASAKIKDGICEYAYSHHMRKLLYLPSVYAQINLVIQSRFSSSYGLALYENCARFRNLPMTKWFSVDDFRKLMGVKSDEYSIFRDFKRRVLDKAVEEVNSLSDIRVTPEIKRIGQKASEIRFAIQQRPRQIRLGANSPISNELSEQTAHQNNTEQAMLVHRMVNDFGILKKVAEALVAEFTAEYIEEKISFVLTSNAFNHGKIKGVAGYLVKAIKENYVRPFTAEDLKSQQLLVQRQEEQKQKEEKDKKHKLDKEYEQYKTENLYYIINNLKEAELNKIMGEWWHYCSEHLTTEYKKLRSTYEDKRFESSFFRGFFKSFMLKNYSHLYQEKTFKEFLTL
ncbi:MAG: replication initiation protein [Legionellales bacterium]|nr:replication initiation protein [Legionellales bacterium]